MTTPHRVLVIDDDQEIRETMVDVLVDHGYAAVGAIDGRDALVQLRAETDGWCVVLLDLMMPNMDGATFRAEQLRDPLLSPIPVVVLSARTDVAEQAEQLQVAAHMTKPLRMADLLATVARFCATGL